VIVSTGQIFETRKNMTESALSSGKGGQKLGFFARIFLFFRQVIAELKKVVTPTRSELVNYFLVVVGFVVVVMLIVTALDFVFGQGSILLFTNKVEQ
jgi:preprotein translocase subunit SecE